MSQKLDLTTYLVLPAVDHYRLLRRIDESMIYPPFLEKLKTLLENCAKKGGLYHVTQGTRTWKEQDALYNQGRTTAGKIVTNARGGFSYHNFGIAGDCVWDLQPHRRGLFPSWTREFYELIATEARDIGLEAGYYWTSFNNGRGDPPHIQLPISKHGISLQQIREIGNKENTQKEILNAVWNFLNKFDWK